VAQPHQLARFSFFLALVNGLTGCAAVSSFYANAKLIASFADGNMGIANSLVCFATVPLAMLGVALGFIALRTKYEDRNLALVGLAGNGMYVLNFVMFSTVVVSAMHS
jgi:hypothetical protein